MTSIDNPDRSLWLTHHCNVPFENVLIDENGNIYLCHCQAYLPKILCNILDIETKEQFWHLYEKNEIKDSIIDKSHKFCKSNCSALQSAFYGQITYNFVTLEKLNKTKLKKLQLCIDNSCNLHCPTCRTEKILHHNNIQYQQRLSKILSKIDLIFFNPQKISTIHLLSGGEFLASKIILNWMFEKTKDNVLFELQTNGNLIYSHRDKCEDIFKKTKELYVSIDAASKEIYDKTRLGGNWNNLIQSLEWIKKNFPKINLTLNYTISSSNYKDVSHFINFCEKYKPCKIYFSRVENWFDNPSLFEPLDIWNENHIENKNFNTILKNIDFNNSNIRINFNDYLHKINEA